MLKNRVCLNQYTSKTIFQSDRKKEKCSKHVICFFFVCSGAGKTTLMTALAHRSPGKNYLKINLNAIIHIPWQYTKQV